MLIHHRTSVATLIQLIFGLVLAFFTALNAIIVGCYRSSGTDCVSNAFVSLLLVLIVAAGYGVVVTVGFLAESRRSPRLALVLIGLEAFASLIFAFDAKQSPDLVDRLANGVALLIAIWVALVAWQLYRAKGARIVQRHSRN